MNEHLFEQIEATVPQHTRRIIVDEGQSIFVAYCTVCAWYAYTGENHTVTDVLVSWVTHLSKVIAYRSETPKDGVLITNTQINADGIPITTVERYGDEKHRKDYADTELDAKGHPV